MTVRRITNLIRELKGWGVCLLIRGWLILQQFNIIHIGDIEKKIGYSFTGVKWFMKVLVTLDLPLLKSCWVEKPQTAGPYKRMMNVVNSTDPTKTNYSTELVNLSSRKSIKFSKKFIDPTTLMYAWYFIEKYAHLVFKRWEYLLSSNQHTFQEVVKKLPLDLIRAAIVISLCDP